MSLHSAVCGFKPEPFVEPYRILAPRIREELDEMTPRGVRGFEAMADQSGPDAASTRIGGDEDGIDLSAPTAQVREVLEQVQLGHADRATAELRDVQRRVGRCVNAGEGVAVAFGQRIGERLPLRADRIVDENGDQPGQVGDRGGTDGEIGDPLIPGRGVNRHGCSVSDPPAASLV